MINSVKWQPKCLARAISTRKVHRAFKTCVKNSRALVQTVPWAWLMLHVSVSPAADSALGMTDAACVSEPCCGQCVGHDWCCICQCALQRTVPWAWLMLHVSVSPAANSALGMTDAACVSEPCCEQCLGHDWCCMCQWALLWTVRWAWLMLHMVAVDSAAASYHKSLRVDFFLNWVTNN